MKCTETMQMIGMPIRYTGLIYVIEELNYLGDYRVVRFDSRRRVWQRTTVPVNSPASGPWQWEAVGPWLQKRFRHAIIHAERLHPHLEIRSKSARAWRRAEAHRGVLRRFFRRLQSRHVIYPTTPA